MFKILIGAIAGTIFGVFIGFGVACILQAQEMDDDE